MRPRCHQRNGAFTMLIRQVGMLAFSLLLFLCVGRVSAMTDGHLAQLRLETEDLFYHGFEAYMKHAYPEDELRSVSCGPLTRDRTDPARTELNDPMGNYSLTLVDSLSTLAILASGNTSEQRRSRAFKEFQNGVISLVELYGDGSAGKAGQGSRSRGFDLDSKVQVFETVIRGIGGLMSAHLFAIGELPITGYDVANLMSVDFDGNTEIEWTPQFSYDGQLLRLALDLGERLLPAFSTSTGIPYPRINLRHGVPFYANSPLRCSNSKVNLQEDDSGWCPMADSDANELTETCSAGAGSLLLEFAVLSRVSGDFRFEHVAKKAFWSIWDRRTAIGLIGSTIDAETGLWTSPYTGIGAGIDSFFEYAVKAYILLSGSEWSVSRSNQSDPWFLKFGVHGLQQDDHDPESFLIAWREAHGALKLHVYRGQGHMYPHYVQSDVFTGASRAYWIDALSAFYPGLLVLAGHVEEAVENHLVFAALWNRYSGLPERWSTVTGGVEGGLGWYLGRPEFIESTYYLHRATEDPFYLHVGEMTFRDIKRRCWVDCGLSGLQDVRSGEHNNRMESFFLGETAKYQYLLFDPDHPLNRLDAPFVFSTEGHPLLIPKAARHMDKNDTNFVKRSDPLAGERAGICQRLVPNITLTVSNVVERPDFFHAADLVRLHMMPNYDGNGLPGVESSADHPMLSNLSASSRKMISPSNFAYYPWTLPLDLIPRNATSAVREPTPTFEIAFPASDGGFSNSGLQRLSDGVMITGMSGLRLSMIQDVPGINPNDPGFNEFRVQTINNVPLGRQEKVYVTKGLVTDNVLPTDPNFTRVRDEVMIDVAMDVSSEPLPENVPTSTSSPAEPPIESGSEGRAQSPLRNFMSILGEQASSIMSTSSLKATNKREYLGAVISMGPGFTPLLDVTEYRSPDLTGKPAGNLLWKRIYVGGTNCKEVLPNEVPREYQVLVLQRGGCSFTEKLENIPSFAPSATSLKLVVIVSYGRNGIDDTDENKLIRPHLDRMQKTSTGIVRRHPIPMVMVGGGQKTYEKLQRTAAFGIKRRHHMKAQGVPITNVLII